MDKSPQAFRTISEVAEYLDTPAHVLRFWESRFPQIRPVKRAGGRRYYRPNDVALLTGIKRLLHDEGMTIRGVQKILREQGVRHVAGLSGEDHADSIEQDAEEALGAALKSFATPVANPLPAPEAESAQILALETALNRNAGPKPEGDSDILPLFRAPADTEPAASSSSDMAENIPDAAFAEDVPTEQHAEGSEVSFIDQDLDAKPKESDSPAIASDPAPQSLSALLAMLRRVPASDITARSAQITPLRDRLSALHHRMMAPPRHPEA